jgi:hypothetical protein
MKMQQFARFKGKGHVVLALDAFVFTVMVEE